MSVVGWQQSWNDERKMSWEDCMVVDLVGLRELQLRGSSDRLRHGRKFDV